MSSPPIPARGIDFRHYGGQASDATAFLATPRGVPGDSARSSWRLGADFLATRRGFLGDSARSSWQVGGGLPAAQADRIAVGIGEHADPRLRSHLPRGDALSRAGLEQGRAG